MANQKVLGVDAGNTVIKVAVFQSDSIGEVQRFESWEEIHQSFPEHLLVISSVRSLEGLEGDHMVLGSSTPIPMQLNYETPETLGPDRLAAAIGTWAFFPGKNILIIDGGTCITYDLVTKDGVFQGGIISPGLEMRYKAMHSFTHGLPGFSPDLLEHPVPGKSTEACMRIGAEEGLKNEIEGFLERFNKKYPDLQVVITGGSLPHFDSKTKKHIFASSKIVLSGLHAIWKFNEGI